MSTKIAIGHTTGMPSRPGCDPGAAELAGAVTGTVANAGGEGVVTAEAGVPRLVEGTELIGQYQGSGFHEPKYLVRRGDGQVAQLSRVLYVLACCLDGRRDLAAVAERASAVLDRAITAEQVGYLLETKLRPVGIAALSPDRSHAARAGWSGHESPPDESDSNPPAPPGAPVSLPRRRDPLLMLRYRLPVIPPRVVYVVAGLLRPLYWPPVLAVMLAAFVGADVWLIARGAVGQIVPAATTLFYQPGLTLLVLAVILVAGMIHEWGHVTACRYGGARPGVMGFGLYLVWPALYSTVTDAYRLGRGGRLRTDLGGVYFNAIVLAGLGFAYAVTGAPWLLVALVVWHVETAWQFLPSIRLDGYYILADLVGVPDLFARLGPVLASLRPGREAPRAVRELKPWTRRIITGWVLLVIPCLLGWLVMFLISAPTLIQSLYTALVGVGTATVAAFRAGHLSTGALGAVKLVLLVLPPAGITLICWTFVRRTTRAATSHWGPGWAARGLRRAATRIAVRHPSPSFARRLGVLLPVQVLIGAAFGLAMWNGWAAVAELAGIVAVAVWQARR